jgi:hypothetical protein
MTNNGSSKYLNYTSGLMLDVFYELREKIADECKNKIMAAFGLETNAPVRTYEIVVRIFASHYPCLLTREIEVVGDGLTACKALLKKHEKIKPGLLLNVFSLGKLFREWNAIRTSIVDYVSAAEDRLGELNARRWDNRHGDSPDALAWARNKVEEIYPTLAEAYRAGIAGEEPGAPG